jgi:selenocysteine lyase/cysteine desulfurase
MTISNRRNFVLGVATAAATASLSAAAQTPNPIQTFAKLPNVDPVKMATDKPYWSAVQSLYAVTTKTLNLENGYWGIMAEPVRADYLAKTDMVNRENSFYARTQFGRDAQAARVELAQAVGAEATEIAFTRGATEAMQLLIGGYNKLKAGDTVLYSDLDYDSMQFAMNWLAERRGVKVVKFNIPEPATQANVMAAYQKALDENPKTSLLLLTHVSHRTGLVMPVAEIAKLAKSKGVAVLLDAAHSWGQIDFKVDQLGVDFIGFNLHKWIGAPLGVGFVYIAKSRLGDIDRFMNDEDFPVTDIRSRVHTGTTNFAAILTVPTALKLHAEIGPKAKALRLQHLRNYWVSRVRSFKGMEILTPDESGMYAGITSFRLAGKTTAAANNEIVTELREKHGIFSVRRAGVANGQCIRISPALFTSEADLDKFVAAMAIICAA